MEIKCINNIDKTTYFWEKTGQSKYVFLLFEAFLKKTIIIYYPLIVFIPFSYFSTLNLPYGPPRRKYKEWTP